MSGAKAFAQEWEYTIEYNLSDAEATHQYCAYEMSDGRVMVCSAQCFQSGSQTGNIYPPHPALIALSSEGEVLRKTTISSKVIGGPPGFRMCLKKTMERLLC